MKRPLRFGIIAGEKSGDNLGAGLISAIRDQFPDAEFEGVGGPTMLALGFTSLAPMEPLSVMGFVEPLARLPQILKIKRTVQEHFINNPPDAFIGIDAPDFNLRVESVLRNKNIPTVHYVSPSVWAYREKRIIKIKQSVDLMLTLFPFETAVYQQHGIAVKCVGHPLADAIGFEDSKVSARQKLGLETSARILALMPGSRAGEIQRLGPTFIAAAKQSLEANPGLIFLIPCASSSRKQQIEAMLGEVKNDSFMLLDGNSHLAISAADAVLLASGTATLEAMLLKRPMVVCYKIAALTYAVASRMMKIPLFALPNLLAGKQLVPEFIQDRVTVPNLVAEINKLFGNPAASEQLLVEFETIHNAIRLNANRQAADAVLKLIAAVKLHNEP
jgi:lipid-A-disaccharide synthase